MRFLFIFTFLIIRVVHAQDQGATIAQIQKTVNETLSSK